MRLLTYLLIIIGGDLGINCALDCRCPKIPPRPEVGEDQNYCGKELKGIDCLPETVYNCKTFNQTIAEPPKPGLNNNCGHHMVNYHCGPYSKKECEDDIECLMIRRCFRSKVYAVQSLREWYATARKNRGRNETGPIEASEQSVNMQAEE